MQSLAIDRGAGLIYAATPNGVFRAPVDDVLWGRAGASLTGLDVQTLAADQRGGLLYAVSVRGDTYLSSDGGQNWQIIPPLQPIFARTVNYSTYNGLAYSGAYRGGVLQSQDHGVNWWPAGHGLQDENIEVLLPDERNGALYAGSLGGSVARLGRSRGRVADA